MANHTIAAGEVAKHGITLTASTVDTVTLANTTQERVQILTDGTAAVYYTLDGSTPTIAGANCYVLPAAMSVDEVEPTDAGSIETIKLISSGTPTLSIMRR